MLDVAVKTLSEKATEAEKILFLQEAVIMGQFLHPNIVQLYGIVTRGGPVSVLDLAIKQNTSCIKPSVFNYNLLV